MRTLRLSAFAGLVVLLLLTGLLAPTYLNSAHSLAIQPAPARASQSTAAPSGSTPGASAARTAVPTPASPHPTVAATGQASTPTPAPPVPHPLATSASVFSHYYYGIGPEADGALRTALVQQARAKILTSWLNGSKDLAWMSGWQGAQVNNWWTRGYVLHVIVYDNAADDPACKCRRWPISTQFLLDMDRLGQIFSGPNDGLHIVIFSLDTELQTYIEPNNQYNAGTAWYYDQLQANLVKARARIKAAAPNALVSFSWGGWQTRWDDPASGAGLSMIPHFAATMRAMDFISFQAMQNDSNVNDILTNVRVFGVYNHHLMVSHYLPDNQSQATYNHDIATFFTQAFVNQTRAGGLFAFSFMSATDMNPGGPLSTCVAGVNQFTQ